MSLSERLAVFLDHHDAAYDIFPHLQEFTSQRVAATMRVRAHDLAKVVIVCDDRADFAMAVLPGDCRLELDRLSTASGRTGLTLASEEEMARLFPDCGVGAMPPFGHLYEIPVYLDGCFRTAAEIFFQGGNHRETIRMGYDEYERLAAPFVGPICFHRPRRARAHDRRREESHPPL
jgi:Ala-tRNA(Pro) deacylase